MRSDHSPPKGFKTRKEYIAKELDLREGDVVVDLGAGDGAWSELMARLVGPTGAVHAGEVEQKKVDQMMMKFTALPQLHPYLCLTDGTGLPPASCDLAFIAAVYHHFEKGAQVTYLQGLRSVLKTRRPPRHHRALHRNRDRQRRTRNPAKPPASRSRAIRLGAPADHDDP